MVLLADMESHPAIPPVKKEETMSWKRSSVLGALVLLTCLAVPTLTADSMFGRSDFQTACAVWHGTTGAGGGESADVLTVKPPDSGKLCGFDFELRCSLSVRLYRC